MSCCGHPRSGGLRSGAGAVGQVRHRATGRSALGIVISLTLSGRSGSVGAVGCGVVAWDEGPLRVGGWQRVLGPHLGSASWSALEQFVASERAAGAVYPAPAQVFTAFELTRFELVRVVIVGQDPYHGPGQAHGLSFSVPPGVVVPPSLRNLFIELQADIGVGPPAHGCLERWADQGVLLLNAVLTVRAHEPGSHRGRGWELFTAEVLRVVATRDQPVVFLCLGRDAVTQVRRVAGNHAIVTSVHPSPLSAYRGFFGSKPFSRVDLALRSCGLEPLDWRVL
jgi:uracil-DNA glycosylase